MTTEPADLRGSSKRKTERSWKTIQKLKLYLEMPPTDSPTLPETWLAKTRIHSWPLASLTVGGGFYVLFLMLGVLDGTLVWLTQQQLWFNSFLIPTLITYLFLVQPVFRRVLGNAIKDYLPLVQPGTKRQGLIDEAYYLKRRWEWLAVALGVFGFWLIDLPWYGNYLAVGVYWFVGGGLVIGLTGWHIYSAIARTRVLADLYGQAQELNLQRQMVSTAPIARWIISVMLGLVGGLPIIALFISVQKHEINNTLVVYSLLILVALLIIIFRKTPAALITRVSIVRALFLFILVATIGTFGFAYFEGWNLDDALYATIITMTTVGYGDFSPSSNGGQFFTIALSLIAVGIGGYAISSIAAFIVEGNFNQFIRGKRVYKQIDQLNNHIILCGAGQVGKRTAFEFYKTRVPFVIIEKDPEIIEELVREFEVPYVEGDATQNQVLELAGIERARGLVTALSDDKSNAFVVLSARELARQLNNTRLRIVTRLNDEKQARKLRLAGADITVSPKASGGRRMAGVMLYPSVYSFLDEMLRAEQQTGQTLRLEEVHVSKINNPSLLEFLEANRLRVVSIGQYTGLLVVAIKRNKVGNGSPYLYTPRGGTLLQRDDILIVLGTPEERAQLRDDVPPNPFEIWQSKVEGIWRTSAKKFVRN